MCDVNNNVGREIRVNDKQYYNISIVYAAAGAKDHDLEYDAASTP